MRRARYTGFLPLLLTAALAGGCAPDAPTTPSISPEQGQVQLSTDASHQSLTDEVREGLAEIARATAAFADIATARAAGYTVWSPDPHAPGATCPSSHEGQMGYHLVNVGLRGNAADPAAGDAEINRFHPEMLLFERQHDGTLRLVGVEYLVFKAAWEREHGVGAAPPEVLGQPLLFSSHSFTPGGPDIEHYELHVWLWTPNPLGIFHPWNPLVSC